jgi:hypothetical protein
MSEGSRKRSLECLRLQADCVELAARINGPRLRSHFVRTAGMWAAMADTEEAAPGRELNLSSYIKQPVSKWRH